MAIALFISVFLISACGLIYELVAGTLASYLVGDSVFQFSTIIGCYLFSMGIGSALSRYIHRGLVHRFVWIELMIGLIGGFSSALLFLAFAYTQAFTLLMYFIVTVIGVLVGLEIPLLMRIVREHFDFRDAVAHVLTFDYIGALAASLLFPIILVPRLGLVRSAMLFGIVNAGVALWSTYLFASQLGGRRLLRGMSAIVLVLLLGGIFGAKRITAYAEDNIYADEIIFARDTRYQHIVLTRFKDDLRLFLNSHLQFSSRDEYRYHESLIHPGLSAIPAPRRVLVLGGGDGLAVREILKYPQIEGVTLVDLDPDMTRLFSTNPMLTALNRRSFLSPKVHVVNADAFPWIDNDSGSFDFIVVDFPDPTNYALGKLYTTAFYRAAARRLSAQGVLVVQSTSPMFARDSFWCIEATLRQAGLKTYPYHVYVPSFGEWGFIIASLRDYNPPPSLPAGLRFLSLETLPALFQFPPDMARMAMPPNTLNDQILVRAYDRDWKEHQPLIATRRRFIAGSCAALTGLTAKGERRVAGSFVNDAFARGHQIRDRAPVAAALRQVRIPLVIVGGGISGLSAAWRLQKRGFRDFLLLEMNAQAGGNARAGENEVSAYPWAAHYVPVPGPKAVYVRELFEELGVLRDGIWNERYLCFSPQERLFLYGKWQEGIEPAIGLNRQDREQFQHLEQLFGEFRATGGFSIPMEMGLSRAPRDLDRLSFADWLRQQRVDSPMVLWYMNYCCRDDYGALAADTSAWAGVHYFASRAPEEKGPLTWPDGNGWITKQLLKRVGAFVRTDQMVRRIERRENRYAVLTDGIRYIAEAVIFAAPTFLAPYLIDGFGPLPRFEYSPWLTANLTVDHPPRGAATTERAWDNVVARSPTLGYVDATHQTLRSQVDRTVWTFYWALAEGSPAANRALLLRKDWGYWCEAILHDLERVHPDIRSCVSRIDVMRMGHAMARPVVGSIFDERRRELATAHGRLVFANSDVSGFSIFEEAQFRGVEAADRIMRRL